MDVCIIGCGAIGKTLARAVQDMESIDKLYMIDSDQIQIENLMKEIGKVQPSIEYPEALEKADLVVEAASQSAVSEYIPQALEKGIDVMIMSVGALVKNDLRKRCQDIAEKKNCKIFIPSGAIAGTDGLRGAAVDDIEEVILLTYKPPSALENVSFLIDQGIDINKIERDTVIFEGSAREAVKHFPKNINVAATVSLAGIGFDRTRVKIIASPTATMNSHRLLVRGRFGEMECHTRNAPFPENLKTSHLAALSAISALKKIASDGIWIGV